MQGFAIDWDKIIEYAVRIVAVLICIMVHEVSHGLAAYRLGDPTAKNKTGCPSIRSDILIHLGF